MKFNFRWLIGLLIMGLSFPSTPLRAGESAKVLYPVTTEYVQAINVCDFSRLLRITTGNIHAALAEQVEGKNLSKVRSACLVSKKDTKVKLVGIYAPNFSGSNASAEVVMQMDSSFYRQSGPVLSGAKYLYRQVKGVWKMSDIDSSNGWGLQNCTAASFSPMLFTNRDVAPPLSYNICSAFIMGKYLSASLPIKIS